MRLTIVTEKMPTTVEQRKSSSPSLSNDTVEELIKEVNRVLTTDKKSQNIEKSNAKLKASLKSLILTHETKVTQFDQKLVEASLKDGKAVKLSEEENKLYVMYVENLAKVITPAMFHVNNG